MNPNKKAFIYVFIIMDHSLNTKDFLKVTQCKLHYLEMVYIKNYLNL